MCSLPAQETSKWWHKSAAPEVVSLENDPWGARPLCLVPVFRKGFQVLGEGLQPKPESIPSSCSLDGAGGFQSSSLSFLFPGGHWALENRTSWCLAGCCCIRNLPRCSGLNSSLWVVMWAGSGGLDGWSLLHVVTSPSRWLGLFMWCLDRAVQEQVQAPVVLALGSQLV